ncbi:MAG: hypothetical protein LBT74_10055 [Acidobacteriota bacterium]|jgi:hypothetical protein|nr:hypothetical protein [Acidobacteriota bacterium]
MSQDRAKNIFRIAVVTLVMAASLASYGRAKEDAGGWEVYDFRHEGNIGGITFETGQASYTMSKTKSITALLTDDNDVARIKSGASFTVVKKVGTVWKVVPMEVGFNLKSDFVELGEAHGYTLTLDMPNSRITSGTYRIVATVDVITTIIADDFKNGRSWTEELVLPATVFAEFKLK